MLLEELEELEELKLTCSKDLPDTVRLNGISFSRDNFIVMAGPCAVESYEVTYNIARNLRRFGVKIFRAGAYKPRTSPYSFQGLKEEGLEILKEIKKKSGLHIITEVMEISDIEKVCEAADILQIGSRNMQNFPLLREVGRLNFPVLLKRGAGSTIMELLGACEYIVKEGNEKVILCERGIRTFENLTRNTLDISAIPLLKSMTRLPVVVDPSHACGRSHLVPSLSLAAIAAGSDGLLIEVHSEPSGARSDPNQSLNLCDFEKLMDKLKILAKSLGKKI